MDRKSFYAGIIVWLILNYLDAIYTIWVTTAGVAYEINPVMDTLLQLGPWSHFFSSKILIGFSFVSTLLYGWLDGKEDTIAFVKWALIISLGLYTMILLNHVRILIQAFL